jgi:hypothetical protein
MRSSISGVRKAYFIGAQRSLNLQVQIEFSFALYLALMIVEPRRPVP